MIIITRVIKFLGIMKTSFVHVCCILDDFNKKWHDLPTLEGSEVFRKILNLVVKKEDFVLFIGKEAAQG